MGPDTKNEIDLNASQAKYALLDNLIIPPKNDTAIAVAIVYDYAFDLNTLHNFPEPRSPDPAPVDLLPTPTRYPETLDTLVEIHESEGKGLGMFAMKDILPGTILLCEVPLLFIADHDAVGALVDKLSPEKKKILMSLSAYIDHETAQFEEAGLHRIVDCNSFEIIDGKSGIFETASRINHSCVPNSSYRWRQSIGRLTIWNRFKLLEGEEVSIDYGHGRQVLRVNYGFECDCGACSEAESEGDRKEQGNE